MHPFGTKTNSLAMKINFNLKDRAAEVSAVRLIITHKGRVYRKYTGISVKTRQWKRTKRDGQMPTNPRDAEKLKEIRLALESRLDEYSGENDILRAIDDVLSDKSAHYTPLASVERSRPSFWEYFREWGGRDCPGIRQRARTCRLIAETMGTSDDWEDVDEAYYLRLVQRMNERGYSRNYQGSIIARLKTVMSEGYRMKYHRNDDFRRFKKTAEQPETVYLTEDEVERLWRLELQDSTECRVRDLFLIGVFTVARFSDYSRLSEKNISGGYITFTQRKTADSVMIPLSPKVAAILRRNGGRAPEVGQNLFNREIKVVCMKAGIGGRVQVTRSRGTRHETSMVPKWKMVSSHTARRTGATLLHKTGIPVQSLMLITGHRSIQSLMHYLRLTKEENARNLKDNPFFK